MPSRTRFKIALALASLCLCLALFVGWLRSVPTTSRPIKMLVTYPITYLAPTLYDDWETMFIGNHIYARLLPEDDKPAIPSLVKEISVTCDEPAGADIQAACRELRVAFRPTPFTDCSGRRYGVADLRDEFEALLKAKAWVMPGWRRCAEIGDEICVTGKNTGDIERRLKNVNFRFGWSKRQTGDTVFGAGPYCLKATLNEKGAITAGVLDPRDAKSQLPQIEFIVGGGKDSEFDVALYGTENLLKGRRKNVQAHTPLAFYVVTNPSLAAYRLPWNTEEARKLLNDHFVRRGVFFSETDEVGNLVPAGNALSSGGRKNSPDTRLEFIIPDYLPGCRELASTLTASWSQRRATASCVNIVTYVQGRVREKHGSWDGFLVGLSPADPGRDSLKLQYFSKYSPDSLTYDHPNPDVLFYRVGIGQSLVTVDGTNICDLRPNVLGLGDVFAADFVRCDQ